MPSDVLYLVERMRTNLHDLVWHGGSGPAARTAPGVVSGQVARFVLRPATIATGLAVTIIGCAPTQVAESPLVDALEPPIVLVEERRLKLPNTGPGNRFVSGWLFDDRNGEPSIEPLAGGARLEVVHLRPQPRTLILSARDETVRPVVGAAIGSRQLGVRDPESKIEVLLPADLEQGRHLVDLDFADRAGVELSEAALSDAARPGSVEFHGDDIVHEPWSAVEFVRWVEPATALVGDFVPPPNPMPRQRFAMVLDRGDGNLQSVFELRPSDHTSDAPPSLQVPLRDTAGLVRIRLVAEGEGAAGRWRGLRLRIREPRKTTAVVREPVPPRVVVVYVLDALRADAVGHLGSDLGATPCIDRLASEGAAFVNHFSVAPNTGPATKSLFTGWGYLRGRAIPETVSPTLAESFAAAGFRTVSVSSNPHLSLSYGLVRGFEDVVFAPIDESFGGVEERDPSVNDSADRVHAAALAWLDRLRPDERAMLYLHTLNPHNPYTPPEPYPSRFVRTGDSSIDGGTKTLAAIRGLEKEVTAADERRIREWYAAGVAYNDAALCSFVDEVGRRHGDDVLLVVTSDHGEELFDHGGVLHGFTLYDELVRVPLVLWWPDRIRPVRIESPTGTLDLTDALRALISARPIATADAGSHLWKALGGSSNATGGPRLHFATAPGLRRAAMVRSDRWKLILAPRPRFGWGMGRGRGRTHDAEYLFDLVADPEERVNLAGASDLEVDWLRSRLQRWLAHWEARQPAIDDSLQDEATRRQLEALGYTE